jgi:8-oxo-dGTP pyrophosphatase MutT (NUDIX family)
MPDAATPQPHPDYNRTRHDYSAGGIAYRRTPGNGRVEIALIATRGGKRWQLPKGSREANESAQETAIREVEEESGLLTEPEAFLCSVDYWYWDTYRKSEPELVHKTVDFFLLRVVGGELSDASYEVDGVGWFTLEEAIITLTFKDEVQAARQAFAALTGHDLTGPAGETGAK